MHCTKFGWYWPGVEEGRTTSFSAQLSSLHGKGVVYYLNGHKTPLPKDILRQLSLKLVLGVWEEVKMWNVYSLQNDKYFCNRALKNSSGKDIAGTWLEYNDKHFENW